MSYLEAQAGNLLLAELPRNHEGVLMVPAPEGTVNDLLQFDVPVQAEGGATLLRPWGPVRVVSGWYRSSEWGGGFEAARVPGAAYTAGGRGPLIGLAEFELVLPSLPGKGGGP
jgi:hypothetical protein